MMEVREVNGDVWRAVRCVCRCVMTGVALEGDWGLRVAVVGSGTGGHCEGRGRNHSKGI